MSDKLLSRFLRYVRIETQSDETSTTFPSSNGDLIIADGANFSGPVGMAELILDR